eukprot:1873399-Pyramimonas_sp.AAC.1
MLGTQTGKPPETSPQSGRERAWRPPTGNIETIASPVTSSGTIQKTENQANRLRHHFDYGANGRMQYPMAAPPWRRA